MDAPQTPGPAPGHARTKLDLLYHDVLGEVVSLVDRLEAVSASLDAAQQQIRAVADNQQVLPQQLARQLTTTLEVTAKPIHQQHQHRRADRVERAAALAQHGVAGVEGAVAAEARSSCSRRSLLKRGASADKLMAAAP